MSRRRPGLPVSIAAWSIAVLSIMAVLAAPGPTPGAAGSASLASEARTQQQPVDCDPTASLRPPAALPPPGRMPAGSSMRRIAQRGFLIAGADQNIYLFGYRDPRTGQLNGFETDFIRAIAQAILGDPNAVQFRSVNVADRVRAVETGAVDMVVNTLSITCERKARVEFSAVYYEAGQRILVNEGAPVTSLADLRGKRVCAGRGSTSLRRVLASRDKPVAVGVPNAEDCLVALQLGEVDAVSTDDTLLAGMAAQDPRVQIVGPRFGDEPYGVAINRNDQDLVRFVNGVLARWIADGSWERSYRHWLGPLGPPPVPPSPRYRD